QTGCTKIEQRNHFPAGATLEFFGPHLPNTRITIKDIWDEEGNLLDAARHPKQIVYVLIPFAVTPFDMIRLVSQ
ncbi:MAG: U32 family peptidase C-terminal domain-containing protein, partial [Bacilli bacterium]|nr:U32 family peptidase C-terminal domain-containing protein [Bacilli bacterium]